MLVNSPKLCFSGVSLADYDDEPSSKPKRYWMKAIDQVINRNFVSKVRAKKIEVKPKQKYNFHAYLDEESLNKETKIIKSTSRRG
jgi:hypothetical protein